MFSEWMHEMCEFMLEIESSADDVTAAAIYHTSSYGSATTLIIDMCSGEVCSQKSR
jgi:hypothetical protein